MTVRGTRAQKPSTLVDADAPVAMIATPRRFASRGGEKLDAALGRFDLDIRSRRCLDAGASTGGFTDCLLQRGASSIVAVDVGYGQLAWELRNDPRVIVLERTNVRDLDAGSLPFRPSFVAADLSFISLHLALPPLAAVSEDHADFVVLVKPQFEAGREELGKGGVVRNPAVWRRVIEAVVEACRRTDLAPRAVMASPLLGPAGNAEFLLHLIRGDVAADLDVEAALDAARELGR